MNAISYVNHRGAWPWRPRLSVMLVPIGLVALFLAGYWPRRSAEARLLAESRASQLSLPRAKVVTAVAVGADRILTLPGNLVPYRQALVNARATGYVSRYRVDIGDRVRAGDILADLDTPELNQQLDQARATLKQKEAAIEQAIANRDYAQLAALRQDALLTQNFVSKQDDDQARAQLKIWQANVHAAQADSAAAQANIRELSQLVSFGHVMAPFDGRITQRNIDIGSLVTAGGATGSSANQALFRIEALDPIRTFVQVPQTYALSVKQATAASITVREVPGRTFDGHVTRTAGTIDPASRTLNVEIDVPNPNGELLGGMFAQVNIAVAVAHRVIRVPSSSVITDARGVHVATIDDKGQVHLVAVQRGLDNGREIELINGLIGGELVMVNPGGDVTDGIRVQAVREL